MWSIEGPKGVESVKVSGPLCADNGDMLKAAALKHMGITLLPTFIVGEEMKKGHLVQVLEDYCPPQTGIYAVYPSRRFLSAKVKTFVDHLKGCFGDEPYWDAY